MKIRCITCKKLFVQKTNERRCGCWVFTRSNVLCPDNMRGEYHAYVHKNNRRNTKFNAIYQFFRLFTDEYLTREMKLDIVKNHEKYLDGLSNDTKTPLSEVSPVIIIQ